jgi:hypothetical protein
MREQQQPAVESQYGVIKLKKNAVRNHPHRNSASLQTSSLQEDLMKLIGQDFENVAKSIRSADTSPKNKVQLFYYPP